MKIKIFLADRQEKVRNALKIILEHQEFDVVGEADDMTSLMTGIKETMPELLLLDCGLGNLRAADIIPVVKLVFPDIKLVALSCKPELCKSALSAGADAFVYKSENPEKLIEAIMEATGQLAR